MLDTKGKFLLVDSRNGSEYKEGYIPTAINVYDKEMEGQKAKFPTDKAFPVVFYCNGYPKCVRSLNGAKMAMTWGYKKVYLVTAGFPDWQARGFPVSASDVGRVHRLAAADRSRRDRDVARRRVRHRH